MTRSNCCSDLKTWLQPNVFKALADPNRVSILIKLAQAVQEQSVSQVADCCPVDLSVVSRHLGILRDAGIVEADKRGKEVFYRVRVKEMVTLLRGIADALEACCPGEICTLSTCSIPSTEGEKE